MAPHQLEGQFIIQLKVPLTAKQTKWIMVIIIIRDNFCIGLFSIGLFSDVHKLTAFYTHIHIYIRTNHAYI